MRHSVFRLLSLLCLAAVLSLTINFSVRSSFASGYDPIVTADHILGAALFDVDLHAVAPRPPCLRCGSNRFIDAHAGDYIRANQPSAAWRMSADTPAPPLRPHSIC